MWLALFLGSLHYGIRAGPIIRVGSEKLPHKVGPNEDVRDLSVGDCNTPI